MSQVLHRCAQAVSRDAARCASQVNDRGAHADAEAPRMYGDGQRRVLSIVSECRRVWRVLSTKAFAFSTIFAGCWRGA